MALFVADNPDPVELAAGAQRSFPERFALTALATLVHGRPALALLVASPAWNGCY
jgi:hypothetical protein